jgi:uncharacterized membrane protein
MSRVKLLWSDLQSSFWFVPSLIVMAAMALAAALIEADSIGIDHWLARWPRLFGTGAEGARGMLSTIAASTMSMVAVTFSITLVALTLASSQYTSRILRNFMRSRVTQSVLGILAGIFAYCLIVLRTIRDSQEGEFIPSVAVFFGFFLALAGVGVLIFFIHHIASSIQASSIIASVARETIRAVDRLFPSDGDDAPEKEEDQAHLPVAERSWYGVPAAKTGYIHSVDGDALLRLAREGNTTVRMERGIGDFVIENTTLASFAIELPPDDKAIAELNGAYSITRHRTVEQDPTFGIREIVDVALKALSSGVNDTSTAVMCVDYLAAVLARVATRRFPLRHGYEQGELRVITIAPTFAGLLSQSFDQIRRSAEGNVAVMARMLGATRTIASLTSDPHRRRALREQVRLIAELAERTIESVHDREQLASQLAEAQEALEADAAQHARQEREILS